MAKALHVGLDGCKSGWIAAFRCHTDMEPEYAVYPTINAVCAGFPDAALIAIDMPIGLPDFIKGAGRGPEQALRPKLGARQSSVFSIPSRDAVYAESYAQACEIALQTSEPPKKVSKQGYYIFPKIREVDRFLQTFPDWRHRILESHPEGVFWRLNQGTALQTPKKQKDSPCGRYNLERLNILSPLNIAPPQHAIKGTLPDDILDAGACLALAEAHTAGLSQCFPPHPQKDEKGLTIAIHV